MRIYQCDKCGTTIETRYHFSVGYTLSPNAELCFACAQPFVELIKKQGLMDDDFAKAFARHESGDEGIWG